MTEYANIVRAASWRYWWPGADREDAEQEAWVALLRARPPTPGLAKTVVMRHLTECVRRETRRRPQFAELEDVHTGPSLADLQKPLNRLVRDAPVLVAGAFYVVLAYVCVVYS